MVVTLLMAVSIFTTFVIFDNVEFKLPWELELPPNPPDDLNISPEDDMIGEIALAKQDEMSRLRP